MADILIPSPTHAAIVQPEADPMAAVDAFERRALAGDSTAGLAAYQSAARTATEYGKAAVEAGANGGATAPGVGPLIGGGIAIHDATEGNWTGAALGIASMVAGLHEVGGEADDAARRMRSNTEQLELDLGDEFKPQKYSSHGKYRDEFFAAHPELRRKVIVHHAIEQQVMIRYPGVITEEELHSLLNLRGIPNDANPGLHLRAIRREWNDFYALHPTATREQLYMKVKEIDEKYGDQFQPPRE